VTEREKVILDIYQTENLVNKEAKKGSHLRSQNLTSSPVTCGMKDFWSFVTCEYDMSKHLLGN